MKTHSAACTRKKEKILVHRNLRSAVQQSCTWSWHRPADGKDGKWNFNSTTGDVLVVVYKGTYSKYASLYRGRLCFK